MLTMGRHSDYACSSRTVTAIFSAINSPCMKSNLAPKAHKYVDGYNPPRRHRTRQQADNRPAALTPGISRVLQLLRHCHVASTDLMFRAWCGEGRGNEVHFRNLMTRVFHNPLKLPHGGFSETPVVFRPGELNPDKGAKCEPAWYALTPAGQALAQEGHSIALAGKRDHWHHRAMGGSVAASFQLLAPEFGLAYGTLEDILLRPKCPPGTKTAANPLILQLDDRRLEPDDFFRLEYQRPDESAAFRYFAREDDRATEQIIERKTTGYSTTSSVEDKLLRHLEVIAKGVFRTHFGITSYRVLFITTAPGRIDPLLDFLRGKPGAEFILFKALPNFSTDHWCAPREPMRQLFEPWETVNGLFDITKL